jgi:hypothetical protein
MDKKLQYTDSTVPILMFDVKASLAHCPSSSGSIKGTLDKGHAFDDKNMFYLQVTRCLC